MTINTVGTLNLSTLFGALFVFSAFLETLDFFSLKKYGRIVNQMTEAAQRKKIRTPFSIPC
jgi:hypothetical protein